MDKKSSKPASPKPAASKKGNNYFADTFGKKVVKKGKSKYEETGRPVKNEESGFGERKKRGNQAEAGNGSSFARRKDFDGDFGKRKKYGNKDEGDARGERSSRKKTFDKGEKGERFEKRGNQPEGRGEFKIADSDSRERRKRGNKSEDDGRKERSHRKPSFDKKEDSSPIEKRKPYNKKGEAYHEGSKRVSKKTEGSAFKKYFDSESDYEKAYSSTEYASRKGKSFNPKSERSIDAQDEDHGRMPLNKYIAHCGICSRRDAVDLIKDGKVIVDGEVVREPGTKMTGREKVEVNGKPITIQKNLLYILMNKPKGYITTTDDPKGRRTVIDIVSNYIDERVFPVGRLDRNTTGLLLLTNDGELAQRLAHPKYNMRKIYQVTLDRKLDQKDFDKVKSGVILEDGKAEVDQLEYLDEPNKIGLEIHSGKNRIVRRIFESLGYTVDKLDRVMYAGLTKKNLLRGKWRFLSKQEIINLKHILK